MEPTDCTFGWGHVLSRPYKMLLNTARPHSITGSQKITDKDTIELRKGQNKMMFIVDGGRISRLAFHDTSPSADSE